MSCQVIRQVVTDGESDSESPPKGAKSGNPHNEIRAFKNLRLLEAAGSVPTKVTKPYDASCSPHVELGLDAEYTLLDAIGARCKTIRTGADESTTNE